MLFLEGAAPAFWLGHLKSLGLEKLIEHDSVMSQTQ